MAAGVIVDSNGQFGVDCDLCMIFKLRLSDND